MVAVAVLIPNITGTVLGVIIYSLIMLILARRELLESARLLVRVYHK